MINGYMYHAELEWMDKILLLATPFKKIPTF
jgi:hypothetical protein